MEYGCFTSKSHHPINPIYLSLMPFSLGTYGFTAMLVLAGIVIINEVIKFVKKDHHSV